MEAVTVTVAVGATADRPTPPEHAQRPVASIATGRTRVIFDVLFTRRNDLMGRAQRLTGRGNGSADAYWSAETSTGW
ncbi:hypothetical protein GCM10017559_14700 [Streptosporangium longisporum]|uniref:Uncharacterized protein n=1 Tax=Streptosporangium longisporum TaxID=46187 RepID=A0ABN3XTK5_9ACTN